MSHCVNTWCKYHNDGFYCRESCGSYIPDGTTLKNIDKLKLVAKEYALFIGDNQVASGTFEEIAKGHENDIVKTANYDWNTFCIRV